MQLTTKDTKSTKIKKRLRALCELRGRKLSGSARSGGWCPRPLAPLQAQLSWPARLRPLAQSAAGAAAFSSAFFGLSTNLGGPGSGIALGWVSFSRAALYCSAWVPLGPYFLIRIPTLSDGLTRQRSANTGVARRSGSPGRRCRRSTGRRCRVPRSHGRHLRGAGITWRTESGKSSGACAPSVSCESQLPRETPF